MTEKEFLDKNKNCASYKHFDHKISLISVHSKVSNKDYIKSHSFKPLIKYVKTIKKYSNKDNKVISKSRTLNYASHFDRCVFSYYSYLLNEHYNNYTYRNNINENVIAYRNNSKKNNIHHAHQAFSFIKTNPESIVFVGDFTNFFDTLDHKYLKDRLCEMLNVKELEDDIYAVYKNITKYAFVEIDELNKLVEQYKYKDKNIILPMSELRKNSHIIKSNSNGYGIPQGISLSSVLSNIYMTAFDSQCSKIASKYKGLYLRYSDDFIMIFPKSKIIDVNNYYNLIISQVRKVSNLELSPNKTKIYYCDKRGVINCDKEIGNPENSKNVIDYLGFSYDGKYVYIRDKTVGKYYYRAYRKIKNILDQRSKMAEKGKGQSNLYNYYTLKGSDVSEGNFLSYVKRCTYIFGKREKVNRILNVHYGKIKRKLK